MTAPVVTATSCRGCGVELARTFLSCPACNALVHAESLQSLAAHAAAREAAGDVSGALGAWRDALALLPPGAPQRVPIAAHVQRLSAAVSEGRATPADAGSRKRTLGTVGALLAAILAKAKFLILGLSKLGTLSSMFVYFSVYWAMYGWPFAAGLAISLYVHEIGHVWMLARYGIRAGAPVFIPGVGALVRLRQAPANPIEDARVGLAGPVWGLGAALVALACYVATDAPIWAVIARTGAVLNLFNLLPIWQLDGGRGFRSLSRPQRWTVAVAVAALAAATGLPWLYVGAALAAWNATRPAPARGDAVGLITFLGLVATLTAVVLGVAAGAARDVTGS